MAARDTTTLGVATTAPVDPWESRVDRGLGVLERLLERRVGPGGGDGRRDGVVAAIVVSGLLWGAHEVLGGRAIDDRIRKLETQQTEIRIQLAAIARAVGADTKE